MSSEPTKLPESYEAALAELEAILLKLNGLDSTLVELATLSERARLCLDFCQDKLLEARQAQEKILPPSSSL